MNSVVTPFKQLFRGTPAPEVKHRRDEFETMVELHSILSEHTPGQQERIMQAVAGRLDEENAGRPDRTYRFEE